MLFSNVSKKQKTHLTPQTNEELIEKAAAKTKEHCLLPHLTPGQGVMYVHNYYTQPPVTPPTPPTPPDIGPATDFITEITVIYNQTPETVQKIFIGMVKDTSIMALFSKPSKEEFMLLALQLGREKFLHYIDLAKKEAAKGTFNRTEKLLEAMLEYRLLLPEEREAYREEIIRTFKFASEEDKEKFIKALDNTGKITSADFKKVLKMVKDSSITGPLQGANLLEQIVIGYLVLSEIQVGDFLGMVKDSSITVALKKGKQ